MAPGAAMTDEMRSDETQERGVIAVVDDDSLQRKVLRTWLVSAGYGVVEFADGQSAVRAGAGDASVVFLDLDLGDLTGLDVLAHLRDRSPDIGVVIMSGHREVESVVAAMRLGAFDYLAKPLDARRTLETARRVWARLHQTRALRAAHGAEPEGDDALPGVVGHSEPMREMARHVRRVLNSDVTVCLLGESGVGKEVVARSVHDLGRRRSGPFVAVNCAAIPASLQESELFGHERGAFTGATATHKGRFEQAQNGTLFLDELGEMSAATQAALLRTLQERSVRRVGGTADIPVNARIVCATHRDLESEVEAGRFRKDLYFRLVVYPVETPPLRARRDDLPSLVGHFLRKHRADVGREVTRLSPDALDVMARYEWPGNVRELQNVVHRAMLSCDGDTIALEHLPATLRRCALPSLPEAPPLPPAPAVGEALVAVPEPLLTLHELEHRAIERALDSAQGSVGKAAKLLGIGRTTLYRRLAELGVPSSRP
jgi:DNA-binding NtrC family response regulator